MFDRVLQVADGTFLLLVSKTWPRVSEQIESIGSVAISSCFYAAAHLRCFFAKRCPELSCLSTDLHSCTMRCTRLEDQSRKRCRVLLGLEKVDFLFPQRYIHCVFCATMKRDLLRALVESVCLRTPRCPGGPAAASNPRLR